MQLRHTEESVIGAGCLEKMSIAKDDDRRIALPTAAEVGCRGRDTGFSVPPHRSGRADFPHPALASGGDAQTARRIGMADMGQNCKPLPQGQIFEQEVATRIKNPSKRGYQNTQCPKHHAQMT
jgi:hypothetical protein